MRAILFTLIPIIASLLSSCDSPKRQKQVDMVYCDSATRLLRHSELFFSNANDVPFSDTLHSLNLNIRVKNSSDTTIDFTSFCDSIFYLDTANILKYAQYDPTNATIDDIQNFKKEKLKEGKQRKSSISVNAIRYVIVENGTSNNIKFITTEMLLVALIEVGTDNGHWSPIQYFQPYPDKKRAYDLNLELNTRQKFIIVDTIKYTGDTTVKARYKLLTDKGFLYSNIFLMKLDKCLAHGFSKKIMDSLSEKHIYFLDTFISH